MRDESHSQLLNDGSGELVSLGLAAQVTGQGLALGHGVKNGLLDATSVLVEAHVPQHHDGAEQEGSGVGKTFSSNIGSRTVDSLEDGALVTNVAGGSETETTNQTSAHIGQNVTVKVRHDQDLVVVGERVGDHLQAGVVEKLVIELDAGKVLGNLTADIEEETVGHLHDGGLVDNSDLGTSDGLGLLEGKSEHTLRRLTGDELDGLNHTVNNDVLNARVFTLSVFSDQNSVDIVVRGLETSDRSARSQVGEEVESSAKSEVEGDVALANGSLEAGCQDLIP